MYTPAFHPRWREKHSKPLEYKATFIRCHPVMSQIMPPLRDLQVLYILSDVRLLKARYVSPGDVWLLFNSALRKHIFFLSTEMAYLEWFQCFYVAVCFSSHSFYIYKLFCGILISITGGGAHKKQNKYFQYNHSASFAEKIHIDTKYGINHRSNWMNKTITVFLRSFSS